MLPGILKKAQQVSVFPALVFCFIATHLQTESMHVK